MGNRKITYISLAIAFVCIAPRTVFDLPAGLQSFLTIIGIGFALIPPLVQWKMEQRDDRGDNIESD